MNVIGDGIFLLRCLIEGPNWTFGTPTGGYFTDRTMARVLKVADIHYWGKCWTKDNWCITVKLGDAYDAYVALREAKIPISIGNVWGEP